MKMLSLVVVAMLLVAFAGTQRADAQQCPKGQTWDSYTRSCQ